MYVITSVYFERCDAVIEHPDITQMNRHGYLNTIIVSTIIGECVCCSEPLYEDQEIIEFYDDLFCDKDCMFEKIADKPTRYDVIVKH